MEKIKKEQIKYIHILKLKANLKDEDYRAILGSKFNASSCKDLSFKQAEVLLKILNSLVVDLATEKQLKKLHAMHKEIYTDKNLNDFIKKYLGKDKNEKNLKVKECSKLIIILEEILEWQEKRGN